MDHTRSDRDGSSRILAYLLVRARNGSVLPTLMHVRGLSTALHLRDVEIVCVVEGKHDIVLTFRTTDAADVHGILRHVRTLPGVERVEVCVSASSAVAPEEIGSRR